MKQALAGQASVFAELAAQTDDRARSCPRCKPAGMSRHGKKQRPLADLKVEQMALAQYRCEGCGRRRLVV